ncbi:BZ3500_MvSof-1268-A1-R1_Chr4-3g07383 [Microbotryum saponariae]|uniref:Pre-mRNA-splicing factor SYF2 n=1 Tax=Microbotryum saponariae TaxID=289078 RepID=A0A2X0NLL4_9BASI|nr:BZ3500_MvSof-1268-A1-R1_Chr4-3g07383 [Microbotryum saponariae]SDA07046.1 BZ3501_MvSof-1269-A2-R1_Chr4-2g07092 [Microbotryum saponariae]
MAPRKTSARKASGAAAKKGKATVVAESTALDHDVEQPAPIPVAEHEHTPTTTSQAEEPQASSSSVSASTEAAVTEAADSTTAATASEGGQSAAAAPTPSLTPEERLAKVKALRQRMTESAKANKQDLITESNQRRDSARNLAKLERKRQQAEAMGEKQQALETGEDLERKRAWDYTIEDNERWDKKVARKNRRAEFSFTDYDDIARRKYKKDMDVFKPDHKAYNAQRAAAHDAAALVASSSSNPDAGALLAAQDLYRDANSFVYADHKPSEDAIDRVIGKINLEYAMPFVRAPASMRSCAEVIFSTVCSLNARENRSRERKNEVEGDITYINEKNKHFNKKLERYYDAVTKDIRDSFERGTAL